MSLAVGTEDSDDPEVDTHYVEHDKRRIKGDILR